MQCLCENSINGRVCAADRHDFLVCAKCHREFPDGAPRVDERIVIRFYLCMLREPLLSHMLVQLCCISLACVFSLNEAFGRIPLYVILNESFSYYLWGVVLTLCGLISMVATLLITGLCRKDRVFYIPDYAWKAMLLKRRPELPLERFLSRNIPSHKCLNFHTVRGVLYTVIAVMLAFMLRLVLLPIILSVLMGVFITRYAETIWFYEEASVPARSEHSPATERSTIGLLSTSSDTEMGEENTTVPSHLGDEDGKPANVSES